MSLSPPVRSPEAAARVFPSGEKAIRNAQLLEPLELAGNRAVATPRQRTSCPVDTSLRLMPLFWSRQARSVPSGEKATDSAGVCPGRRTRRLLPAATSHSQTVPSWFPDAKVVLL